MRVVFITHNDLGLACLTELRDLGADIQAVVTRPPDPDIADQTSFESFTSRYDIDHHEVEDLNTPSVEETIRSYEPELLFVVGWSRLVEQPIIDIASVATLGMHPAPLPRGRGRAPIAWSLIKGLSETRLCCFHLVEAADAGDIAASVPIPIDIDDDAQSLYTKVVAAGREIIHEIQTQYDAGAIERHPQDDDAATWWPKRTPTDGLIDWHQPPGDIHDWIRGQSRPYPGAFTYLDDEKVTCWASRPPSGTTAFVTPGEIAHTDGEALGVGAWEGHIELTSVQFGDDAVIPAAELLDRYDVSVGDRFTDVRDIAVSH